MLTQIFADEGLRTSSVMWSWPLGQHTFQEWGPLPFGKILPDILNNYSWLAKIIWNNQ